MCVVAERCWSLWLPPMKVNTYIFRRANISVLMYLWANRAEISIRACGSSSVLCRHLVLKPFGSKSLLCLDLVLENKRAYFRFGGHLLEIHSNSYENQGATSGANKRKRAQISATGRKIKSALLIITSAVSLSTFWTWASFGNLIWKMATWMCVCMEWKRAHYLTSSIWPFSSYRIL